MLTIIHITDVSGRNGPFHAWVQTVQVQWTHLMRNVLVVCRPHEHQHFPTHHHRLYPTLHRGTSPPCPPWMCSHPSGESLHQQNSSELDWKENTTDKPYNYIDTDEYSGMFLIVIAWIRNERVSTLTPQTSISRMVTVVDTNPTVSTVNKLWFSPVAVEVIQKYSSSSSAKAGKTVGCGTCIGTCQQG